MKGGMGRKTKLRCNWTWFWEFTVK